jgi:hypothetical protein
VDRLMTTESVGEIPVIHNYPDTAKKLGDSHRGELPKNIFW